MRAIEVQAIPQSEMHKPAGQRTGHTTERLILSDIIGTAPKGTAGDVVHVSLRTGRSITVDLAASESLPVVNV